MAMDREAIATALLLGCTFWRNPECPQAGWFINDEIDSNLFHPLEAKRRAGKGTLGMDFGWPSKSQLARDYIVFTLEKSDGPTT